MRPEFVAGFTVAEGSFTSSGDPPRFAFTVALGAEDTAMCDALRAYFAVGRRYQYARRKAHHDDVSIFTVQSRRELLEVIVPFMDAYLPSSGRRRQYDVWRAKLVGRGVTPRRRPAAR